MHFLNWTRKREKMDCWSKYQGSSCFLPQKWACKGLRKNSFQSIFSPSFVRDSRTMSLVAEMGNFLPKLSLRSHRTLSWPVPIQRLMWVSEQLLILCRSVQALLKPVAMPCTGTRWGQVTMRGEPAQSFLSLSADVSSLWTQGSSGKAILKHNWSQSHDLLCGRMHGQSFQDKVCYGLQECHGILCKARK